MERRAAHTKATSFSHAAFTVEAIILLVFLVGALAVFTQLFARATTTSQQAAQLEQAVVLATDTAEQFSADPTSVAAKTTHDDLTVTCSVTQTQETGGTLYNANIVVSSSDSQVYSISTARYVSGVER